MICAEDNLLPNVSLNDDVVSSISIIGTAGGASGLVEVQRCVEAARTYDRLLFNGPPIFIQTCHSCSTGPNRSVIVDKVLYYSLPYTFL